MKGLVSIHGARRLALIGLFLGGCLTEEDDPLPEIGTARLHATVTSLDEDCYICNDGCVGDACGGTYQPFGVSDDCTSGDGTQACESDVTQAFVLLSGQALYLSAQGRLTSTVDYTSPQSLKILCQDDEQPDSEIHTTQNLPGNGSLVTMTTRMLLMGPGIFSCNLQSLAGRRPNEPGYHVFQETDTKLTVSGTLAGGWRWGTEYEAAQGTLVQYQDECCTTANQAKCCRDGVGAGCVGYCRRQNTMTCTTNAQCDDEPYQPGIYIGPDATTAVGLSEYVLHHPSRFSVPGSAPKIDVYSEPQLTGCPKWSVSCPIAREGNVASIGTTVQLRLYVQQMCTATSSTVARTTTVQQDFSITATEHHKKAHLVANDVPIVTTSSLCPGGLVTGRTFKVKTLVTWLADANVKVEHGNYGTSGYSTSFAFPDY